MQKLSAVAKLKLVSPLTYLLLSLVFLVSTWPTSPELHHIVGACVIIIAFIFWLVARIQLGDAFTIFPEANSIVSTGLYSKLRHPVYYFSLLVVAGLSIYVWKWPMLLLLGSFMALQVYRAKKEEQLLSRRFKGDYQLYKSSTWF